MFYYEDLRNVLDQAEEFGMVLNRQEVLTFNEVLNLLSDKSVTVDYIHDNTIYLTIGTACGNELELA